MFKRWQNKSYSIFNSLKKIVIILVLPVIYLVLSFNNLYSQTDSILISEILIKSQRKKVNSIQNPSLINIFNRNLIKTIPASDLTDLIDGSAGVDFQHRGQQDVQADISIRGGNFDQVLVLLNGIPISDVQTGHNSFSVSLPFFVLDRIVVLLGPGTNIYGAGAYSGSIDISTKKNEEFFGANFKIGENYFQNYNVFISENFNKLSLLSSLTHKKSDGYFTNTDFKINSFYISLNYSENKYNFFNQLYLIQKSYGAYSFYTPKFPYQFEDISKFTYSSSLEFGKNLKHKITAYWNRGKDNFQLFREDKDWYVLKDGFFVKNGRDTAKYVDNSFMNWAYYKEHNYHITNILGATISTNFETFLGTTYIGFNITNNDIKSTVLGLDIDTVIAEKRYYLTYGDNRTISNCFIEQNKKIADFSLNLGLNYIQNKAFGAFFTFNSQFSYLINDKTNLYASVNQGLRLPSYTDLYYNGPDNIGNQFLKPEKATNYEIGFKKSNKKISLQTAIFISDTKNTIDWVKFSAEDKWQTMNYTKLITSGFQLATNLYFNKKIIDNLIVNYTYLYQIKPETDYLSKYMLNYLKHNFMISSSHKIIKNIFLNFRCRYFYRNGSYYQFDYNTLTMSEFNFKPVFLIDAKVDFKFKRINFYAEVSNILNTEYYDLSYIKLQGRNFMVGISWIFEKKE